jgi:hypothetical protein
VPSTEPHESIKWALQAWPLRDLWLPNRHHRDLALRAFHDGYLHLVIPNLIAEIELWIKDRLEQTLRSSRGQHWWGGIPERCRRSAAYRYKWASDQLGKNRVAPATSTVWLSFGDALSTLAALPLEAWQRCLLAENKRRAAFAATIRPIKFFRDYHLAVRHGRRFDVS